jgi:hypothetical protein
MLCVVCGLPQTRMHHTFENVFLHV